ncbi:MAG: molybdenum cofactor guanylyltransferase, partial [bacterium]|nr:molybdenum cofactor guanylyltransferase [bacterium]
KSYAMINVGGIVLCGGQSRRMGKSKAWLQVGQKTMLSRIVDIVRETVSPVAVVAGHGQSLPPLPPDVILIRDPVSSKGPLMGVYMGLKHLRHEVEAVFVTGCDTPLLRRECIEFLIHRLDKWDIVAAKEGDFFHPLFGVYRTSVVSQIIPLLRDNRLSLQGFLGTCKTRGISLADLSVVDPTLDSIRNVNTPEEYQEILDIVLQQEG